MIQIFQLDLTIQILSLNFATHTLPLNFNHHNICLTSCDCFFLGKNYHHELYVTMAGHVKSLYQSWTTRTYLMFHGTKVSSGKDLSIHCPW